jgi:hypothetical protein
MDEERASSWIESRTPATNTNRISTLPLSFRISMPQYCDVCELLFFALFRLFILPWKSENGNAFFDEGDDLRMKVLGVPEDFAKAEERSRVQNTKSGGKLGEAFNARQHQSFFEFGIGDVVHHHLIGGGSRWSHWSKRHGNGGRALHNPLVSEQFDRFEEFVESAGKFRWQMLLREELPDQVDQCRHQKSATLCEASFRNPIQNELLLLFLLLVVVVVVSK